MGLGAGPRDALSAHLLGPWGPEAPPPPLQRQRTDSRAEQSFQGHVHPCSHGTWEPTRVLVPVRAALTTCQTTGGPECTRSSRGGWLCRHPAFTGDGVGTRKSGAPPSCTASPWQGLLG